MDNELRVDHHPQSIDSISDLLLGVSLRVREHGIYLPEYFDKILAFLFIALELCEGVLDLVDYALYLEHFLDLSQILILLSLSGLLVFIVLLLEQDT